MNVRSATASADPRARSDCGCSVARPVAAEQHSYRCNQESCGDRASGDAVSNPVVNVPYAATLSCDLRREVARPLHSYVDCRLFLLAFGSSTARTDVREPPQMKEVDARPPIHAGFDAPELILRSESSVPPLVAVADDEIAVCSHAHGGLRPRFSFAPLCPMPQIDPGVPEAPLIAIGPGPQHKGKGGGTPVPECTCSCYCLTLLDLPPFLVDSPTFVDFEQPPPLREPPSTTQDGDRSALSATGLQLPSPPRRSVLDDPQSRLHGPSVDPVMAFSDAYAEPHDWPLLEPDALLQSDWVVGPPMHESAPPHGLSTAGAARIPRERRPA